MRMPKSVRGSKGQALVETILMVPLLLAIVLNAINFAYFALMALDITSTSRTSGLYSITGSETPAEIPLPLAGSFNCSTPGSTVSDLACQDLTGAVSSPSTSNTGMNICSPSVGIVNAGTGTQHSLCTTLGIGSFPTAEPDPECSAASGNPNPPCSVGSTPAFYLNRVDVAYKFTPLIPFMPFNLIVMTSPACTTTSTTVTCTFYRHTVMRVMGP
jgi:Flp pilus assembly protein TadG